MNGYPCGMAARVRILEGLAAVDPASWAALCDDRATPFVEGRFLRALEAAGCASPGAGWTPRHLTLWRDGCLIAAAPAYLKGDSDGDFSRDFDLADATLRAGRVYYPKLVVGVPFTPVTGGRLLVAPGEDRVAAVSALLAGAREVVRAAGGGTAQVLFPGAPEAQELAEHDMRIRVSHQYHWRNEGYREPGEFLARFTSKRRAMIRRERAAAAGQGIAIRTLRGDELSRDPLGWARRVSALHSATVEKLAWGRAWLNLAFYERIFATMPEHLEVVAAHRDGRLIAGAFNVASKTHLYGRYWGCLEEEPFLHFNVCYYHSIDECIARGVEVFEGGAGGEQKLSRGFLPSETYSAHLFLDLALDRAFGRHLAQERAAREAGLAAFLRAGSILRPLPRVGVHG